MVCPRSPLMVSAIREKLTSSEILDIVEKVEMLAIVEKWKGE